MDATRTWHEDLIDAAVPHLRERFWQAVWLLDDGTIEAEEGGICLQSGDAVRRATRGGNKLDDGTLTVSACYVVHQAKDHYEVHACSSRNPKIRNRWRSLPSPLRDGPLHVRAIVRETKRTRISSLAG